MDSVIRRQTLGDLLRRSAAQDARQARRRLRRRCAGPTPSSMRSSARVAAGLARSRDREGRRGSRFSRATRTRSPRCGSRSRGSAPCSCRSTSCSSPRKSPSFCATPGRHAGDRQRARRRSRAPQWRLGAEVARPHLAALGGPKRAAGRHDRLRGARRLPEGRRRTPRSTAPTSADRLHQRNRSPRRRARCSRTTR